MMTKPSKSPRVAAEDTENAAPVTLQIPGRESQGEIALEKKGGKVVGFEYKCPCCGRKDKFVLD
jgi:hypothetical protein